MKVKRLKYFESIDKTNCYINTNKLLLEDKKDIEYMLKILTCVLRTEVMDVIHKKISKEERKATFIWAR